MKTPTTQRSPLGSDHCSASFVAGPWEVKKARTVLRVMGESLICEISLNASKVDWMPKDEWIARETANATLLAAAPEMVAELIQCEAILSLGPFNGTLDRVREVLAKALGPDWQNPPDQPRQSAASDVLTISENNYLHPAASV